MAKQKAGSAPESGQERPGGFSDVGARFEHRTADELLFEESLALQRHFRAIGSEDGRRKLLEYARRLADDPGS